MGIYDSTDTKAVVHLHAPYTEAVSCLVGGLDVPPGSEFYGRIAYHDWRGVSDDESECQEIVAAIQRVPNCVALIARTHGAFTWGSSIQEAAHRHQALEAACKE